MPSKRAKASPRKQPRSTTMKTTREHVKERDPWSFLCYLSPSRDVEDEKGGAGQQPTAGRQTKRHRHRYCPKRSQSPLLATGSGGLPAPPHEQQPTAGRQTKRHRHRYCPKRSQPPLPATGSGDLPAPPQEQLAAVPAGLVRPPGGARTFARCQYNTKTQRNRRPHRLPKATPQGVRVYASFWDCLQHHWLQPVDDQFATSKEQGARQGDASSFVLYAFLFRPTVARLRCPYSERLYIGKYIRTHVLPVFPRKRYTIYAEYRKTKPKQRRPL
jgi:hypothetical protein